MGNTSSQQAKKEERKIELPKVKQQEKNSKKYVYEFDIDQKAEGNEKDTEVLRPTQTHTITNFQITQLSPKEYDVSGKGTENTSYAYEIKGSLKKRHSENIFDFEITQEFSKIYNKRNKKITGTFPSN